MIEGLIWSPRGGHAKRGELSNNVDDWPSEEVFFGIHIHLGFALYFQAFYQFFI